MIRSILAWLCDYNFVDIPINRRAALYNEFKNAGVTNDWELEAILDGDSGTAYLLMLEHKVKLLPGLEAIITPTPKWQTSIGLFFSKGADGCECCLGWRILIALLLGVAVGVML